MIDSVTFAIGHMKVTWRSNVEGISGEAAGLYRLRGGVRSAKRADAHDVYHRSGMGAFFSVAFVTHLT